MPIRVPLVDDHASFRSLARRLLVDEGLDVDGETSDGRRGAQAVVELRPDRSARGNATSQVKRHGRGGSTWL